MATRTDSKKCTRGSLLQIDDTSSAVNGSSEAVKKTEDQGQDGDMQKMSSLQNLGGVMVETTRTTDDISQLQTVPEPATSDTVVSTLDALRSFPEVHREVASRVDELIQQPGPCSVGKNNLIPNRQSLKTGRYRGREDIVVRHVVWPFNCALQDP